MRWRSDYKYKDLYLEHDTNGVTQRTTNTVSGKITLPALSYSFKNMSSLLEKCMPPKRLLVPVCVPSFEVPSGIGKFGIYLLLEGSQNTFERVASLENVSISHKQICHALQDVH